MPPAVTILTLALGLLPVQPPDTSPEILSSSSGVGRALLIGCSDYETFDQDLLGPANDVQLFAELLRKHFGFEERNVMRLAGWPDNPAARPTAENIAAAFERLIAATESGDRIVILLAGHGTRLPIPAAQIDPLDPANPEPDGFDEAFLPADYRPATEESIANDEVPASRAGRALRDDEFGRWLDRLEARGAHVWILFDCCHSGTMTRSADSRERTRGVPAAAVGPSSAALQAAAAKVESLRDAAPESAGAMPTAGESSATGAAAGGVSGEQAGLAGTGMSRAEGGGSVVAFYAAQAFETAPETRIPFDAPDLPDNYHGVFTHTLCTVLSGGGVTTYRGLGRRLLAQYRADRGSHGPTPFFAGPLDRAVLETGAPADPPAPQLTQRGGVWWVEGGALAGLQAGSILAVRADDAGPEAPPLAFVKVTAAGPTESEVVPTGHDGVAPVSADALPEGGRCEVVVRDFGDARVGLSLLPHAGADAAAVA
ncbi:caspase family protein, partial [Alienimonas sp. DA493]|uniref:caspase family protein n=1 Tax=Alienimonas sp. DA493 TaxID=3373605 RepID=UPI003754E87F